MFDAEMMSIVEYAHRIGQLAGSVELDETLSEQSKGDIEEIKLILSEIAKLLPR